MALAYRKLGATASYLLVDESGQSRQLDNLMTAVQMLIRGLFVAGDMKQIQPYRDAKLENAPDYNNVSVATWIGVAAPHAVVYLKEAYRSHKNITDLVSKAGYDNSLTTRVTPQIKNKITGSRFPLMRQNYPAMFILMPSKSVKLPVSRRNVIQCKLAVKIIE